MSTNPIVTVSVKYLILGALAAGLLLYTFGRLDALLGRHDAEITNASLARIHAHSALARYRAKLFIAEQRFAATATHDAWQADSLRRLLATTTSHIDTVRILGQIASADSSAYQACSVAYRTCQERATSAENEATALTAQLAAQVKVHDRRCGVMAGGGPTVSGKGFGFGASLILGCRFWP